MVRYISKHTAFVQEIHSSEEYQNSSREIKKRIDEVLKKKEFKEYFGREVVPQLTLHESFVLAFLNSNALHQRTFQEQDKILKYINSTKFEKITDNLEGKINKILRI